MVHELIKQSSFFNDIKCVTKLEEIEGKAIFRAIKYKSSDSVIKALQLVFVDGTYCIIISDNPRTDINLMDDTERLIPDEYGQIKYGA